MTDPNETITINANIEITAAALQTIVATAKTMAGKNEKAYYRVDTAELVSTMISRFLLGKNFEAFTQDRANYPDINER